MYHRLLGELGVKTPKLRVLQLSAETLSKVPELQFVGTKTLAIRPGLHLGSQYPVDPERVAVFDFLPGQLLQKVSNRDDFAKILVSDIFVNQTDSRQAIFFRSRPKEPIAFQAMFVDHGFAFGGVEWMLKSAGQPTPYFDRSVYEMISDAASVMEGAIATLTNLSEQQLEAFAAETPEEWWKSIDRDAFKDLCVQLQRRKPHLRGLIDQMCDTLEMKSRSLALRARDRNPQIELTPALDLLGNLVLDEGALSEFA